MGGVDAGGGITRESGACEAGSASSCAGGVEMGEANDGIAGIDVEGDVFNGGVAGQEKGKRTTVDCCPPRSL